MSAFRWPDMDDAPILTHRSFEFEGRAADTLEVVAAEADGEVYADSSISTNSRPQDVALAKDKPGQG